MSFRATRILSLGRIERYVLIQQARALTVALAVIASLIMLIDFVEISRGVGSDVDLSALRILGLMGMKSPAVILQLMPFVFLFGTLAAYVGLNRRSELIAMRAAGLSAWRFVLPAAGTALIFGVLTGFGLLGTFRHKGSLGGLGVIALLTGLWLGGEWGFATWVWVKLALVLLLAAHYGWTGRMVLRARRGVFTESDRYLRIFNEISVFGVIAILWVVVAQPF